MARRGGAVHAPAHGVGAGVGGAASGSDGHLLRIDQDGKRRARWSRNLVDWDRGHNGVDARVEAAIHRRAQGYDATAIVDRQVVDGCREAVSRHLHGHAVVGVVRGWVEDSGAAGVLDVAACGDARRDADRRADHQRCAARKREVPNAVDHGTWTDRERPAIRHSDCRIDASGDSPRCRVRQRHGAAAVDPTRGEPGRRDVSRSEDGKSSVHRQVGVVNLHGPASDRDCPVHNQLGPAVAVGDVKAPRRVSGIARAVHLEFATRHDREDLVVAAEDRPRPTSGGVFHDRRAIERDPGIARRSGPHRDRTLDI